jgi:glycosyltransferase involved in cell wall biosynthesis
MTLQRTIDKTVLPAGVEFPRIEPVPDGVPRPFWSVMIPTYNRTTYLEQTLRSILEQDPGPDEMQIEVIDNFSTETDPAALVRRVAGDRVTVYRQPKLVPDNWNACIRRARGQWVHILHDDDLVLPGFYAHLQEGIEREPAVGAAWSRYVRVDEQGDWLSLSDIERRPAGILADWIQRIGVAQLIQCPAIVTKREVYETLGGFCPQAGNAVDWEMWKRIAVYYPVWYEPAILAGYRIHSSSGTSQVFRSGAVIADTRKVIAISRSYLPPAMADDLSRRALIACARFGLSSARWMIMRGGDKAAAFTQIREGLKCSMAPRILWNTFLMFLWAGGLWAGRALERLVSRKEKP